MGKNDLMRIYNVRLPYNIERAKRAIQGNQRVQNVMR